MIANNFIEYMYTIAFTYVRIDGDLSTLLVFDNHTDALNVMHHYNKWVRYEELDEL